MTATQTVPTASRTVLDRSPSSTRIAAGTTEPRGVHPRWLQEVGDADSAPAPHLDPHHRTELTPIVRDAIISRIALATGRDRGEIERWAHVFALPTFLDSAGAIDETAVDTFASTWRRPAPTVTADRFDYRSFDPVRDAIANGTGVPVEGGTGR